MNGYIDDEVWFGDEITPGILHDELYSDDMQPGDDVRIVLNSYGGSCNAATQMYDEIRSYPGNVHIIISGTAASAATVVAMAAGRLEMTPGSLFMIHDPITAAYGNERDLQETIGVLRAVKDSIINVYTQRCVLPRENISAMMSDSTWMDAKDAQMNGFVDGVLECPGEGIDNAAFGHVVNAEDAKRKYQAWIERRKAPKRAENAEKPENLPDAADTTPKEPRFSADERLQRLNRLKYTY